MSGAKINYIVKDCELAALNLSKHFIDKGYSTDVVKAEDTGFTTIIYRERFLKNILGNPTVITCSFYPLDDGTGIEVKEGYVELTAENIIKDIVYHALIVPGILKRIEVYNLKLDIKKQALKTIKKMNKKG